MLHFRNYSLFFYDSKNINVVLDWTTGIIISVIMCLCSDSADPGVYVGLRMYFQAQKIGYLLL